MLPHPTLLRLYLGIIKGLRQGTVMQAQNWLVYEGVMPKDCEGTPQIQLQLFLMLMRVEHNYPSTM